MAGKKAAPQKTRTQVKDKGLNPTVSASLPLGPSSVPEKWVWLLTVMLVPLLFVLHFSDGQFSTRKLINYDDLELIKPMLDLSLVEYVRDWLPHRDNHAYPLRDLTYFFDHWLTQSTGWPWFWITEVVLLVATTLVVGLCFVQILPGSAPLVLTLATVFALHPMNIEIVQWAMGRKHLMAMLFVWLGMLLYWRRARENQNLNRKDWFVLWGLYLVSLLSFPTALLWMPWILWQQWRNLKMRKQTSQVLLGAGLLVVAAYLVMTMTGEADYANSVVRFFSGDEWGKPISFTLMSLGRGFWNLIFPYWLATYYREDSPFIILGLFALAGFSLWLYKVLRHKPEWNKVRELASLGLALMLPSALVFVGFPDFVWADRYGFIVLPILLALLGLGLTQVKPLPAGGKVLVAFLVGAWLVGCIKITVQRVPLWRDAVVLMKECANNEKSAKCIVQTAQRAVHTEGCGPIAGILERGRALYASRPSNNTEFKSEMPFYDAICIALSAKLSPDEKLKRLPYLFDIYEGAGEIMFSIILAQLEAGRPEAAFADAKSYFLSGDPRPLISTRNTVNTYMGAAKALCEIINSPECQAREKKFFEANQKTQIDKGYRGWGYRLVKTMHERGSQAR